VNTPPPAPLLEVDQLQVAYKTRRGVVKAVENASLRLMEGEAVGIVGESGSGKSTIARTLLGLLPRDVGRIVGGTIRIEGRDVANFSERNWESIRGNPIAMVFQDPLSFLNPVMRIGRQILESVRRHDPEANAGQRVQELLDLVKLPTSARFSYAHQLSGGMRQRVLMAIALGCRPRLLIADEPTTALDVTTQAEIMALLADLQKKLGMGLLMISHDLGLIASTCNRIYVMYAGRTIEWGPTRDVFGSPAHPYTIGLLKASRADRDENNRFVTIGGNVPNLAETIVGCPFAPRCTLAFDKCREEMPTPFTKAPEQFARCWKLQ
jgi:oligopeptide/dipeptide ABC transporter ATP-binding protein